MKNEGGATGAAVGRDAAGNAETVQGFVRAGFERGAGGHESFDSGLIVQTLFKTPTVNVARSSHSVRRKLPSARAPKAITAA